MTDETTVTIYNDTCVRAETEIETDDGPAILVIDQDMPVALPVTVYLQTPDGISRDTIEYDGHAVGGVDGAEITCGIIDLLGAICEAS